jgi:hypothetical protein
MLILKRTVMPETCPLTGAEQSTDPRPQPRFKDRPHIHICPGAHLTPLRATAVRTSIWNSACEEVVAAGVWAADT